VKALTICQPYAHLILTGAKRVENRTWPTRYRGRLYVHAGKSREWLDDPGEYETAADRPPNYGIPMSRMAFGCVVAVANLVDCVRCEYMTAKPFDDATLRKYPWLAEHVHASGPWCWVLESVTPIGPWPYRGAQGLFNIDDDELDAIANKALGVKP
jgi:hypothetical protein